VAVGVRAVTPDPEIAVGKVRFQEQVVWAREGGLQFIQQADVPHFVERLGDVEKNCRTQCAFLKACHDLIDNAMRLLDRGVAGSKTKLVARDEVGEVHIRSESRQEEFFKDLGQNGEKADRAIRSYVMGRFARFWDHYDLCKFPQEWVVGEAKYAVVEGGKEDDSRVWQFLEHLPCDEVVAWRLAHVEARNRSCHFCRGEGWDRKGHGAGHV
jgi:hypothetical protein